jgi:hypothetical protein
MSILSLHRRHLTAAALLHRGEPAVNGTALVPTLTDDEHVLCRVAREGSLTALGTDAALHYRVPGGAWRKVAWTDITAANWSARTGRVHLRTALPGRPVQAIELAANPQLAAFAAERIAHVHIIRRRVELMPAVFATVEAVRACDRDAPQWRVRLEPPAHQDDPLVQQACREVIRELRSQTGC